MIPFLLFCVLFFILDLPLNPVVTTAIAAVGVALFSILLILEYTGHL